MSTTVMAYGTGRFNPLPDYGIGAGFSTPFGQWVPPGSRVIYVRSTGAQDGDTSSIKKRLLPTLAAALQECRSGLGDTVIILPGHSENVTDATMMTNLVAGTRIIGIGWGSNRPTFRWTATGGQWAISVADVQMAGLRLRMEGANGVTKAILVTAADFVLDGCDIEIASGASAKAAIGIEIGAGGTRATIQRCVFRGTSDIVTDPVKVVSAVDGFQFNSNLCYCAGTAATGIVHFTAAATNVNCIGNTMSNIAASSVGCIGCDAVAVTGVVAFNSFAVNNNGVAANQGFVPSSSSVKAFQNFCSDESGKSGVLAPAAVAT